MRGRVRLLLLAHACASPLPNIVLLLSDDLGFADVSFNPEHGPEVSTPHIDALRANGTFFSNAYVTASICAPSRAGLMTGRYQQRVGVYTDGEGSVGFDPRVPLLPAYLPRAYASAAIGKWHLGFDGDAPGLAWHALNRGFTEAFTFMTRGACAPVPRAREIPENFSRSPPT